MEINNSWHLLSLFQINSKFKVCLVKQSGKNFRFILFIKIHLNIIIDKYQYGYSIFAKVYKNEFEKCNLLICNGWCVERWTRWNNVFKIKKSNDVATIIIPITNGIRVLRKSREFIQKRADVSTYDYNNNDGLTYK